MSYWLIEACFTDELMWLQFWIRLICFTVVLQVYVLLLVFAKCIFMFRNFLKM